MVNDDDYFLTVKEFASLLRVHPNTIRRAIKLGKISAYKLHDGKFAPYRIPRPETQRLSIFDLEKIVEALIAKRLNRK